MVHEQLSSYRLNTVLARDWHPVFGTNIAHQTSFSKGDIDKGFAEADEIFDDTFHSQQVQHCSLEPHAVVAEWNGDRLTVWTSTQKVFLVRSGLADLFDLPEDKIRVIGSKVGAGFGGKNAMRLEPYAAALALKTGKPVRLVNSRAEEFSAAAGSVPATVRVQHRRQKRRHDHGARDGIYLGHRRLRRRVGRQQPRPQRRRRAV